MANFRASIVTPWVSTAADNHPLLSDEYPYLTWSDVTGQPVENIAPDPNELTVEVAVDEAVLAAIELDATYEVLWSEEI